MSAAKTLLKNTGILVIGEILSRVLSLLLIIFIARHLGEVGLGKYSFIFAFVGIFSIFSDLGINIFMTREMARNKSQSSKYLGNVISFKLLLAFVSGLIPFIAILFSWQGLDIKMGVGIAAFSMFMYYMAFPFRAVVNVFEMQGLHSIYLLSERVIAFLLGTFVLYKGYGIVALVLTLAVSNTLSLFLLYSVVTKKVIKLDLQFDWKFIRSMLKKSLPFWFTTIFMTIYFRIDTVMLSFMKDYAAAGLYNASYKIIDALSFLPSVLITTIFPIMSKLHKKSRMLHLLYSKSYHYFVALALPIGLGVAMLSARIILFVYEQDFLDSIAVLQILIWALVLMFVNYLMGFLLNSIEQQKIFTYTTGLSAGLNIVINLFLIPRYGIVGAAFATVASEIFNFIMLYYFTSKNGFRVNLAGAIVRPLIAGIIMCFIVYFISFMHLLAIIPIGAASYFLVFILIGGVQKEEIDIAKCALLRR